MSNRKLKVEYHNNLEIFYFFFFILKTEKKLKQFSKTTYQTNFLSLKTENTRKQTGCYPLLFCINILSKYYITFIPKLWSKRKYTVI